MSFYTELGLYPQEHPAVCESRQDLLVVITLGYSDSIPDDVHDFFRGDVAVKQHSRLHADIGGLNVQQSLLDNFLSQWSLGTPFIVGMDQKVFPFITLCRHKVNDVIQIPKLDTTYH